MKIIYIGAFPHPYGGVTIKNHMLYKELKKYVPLKSVDLSKIRRKNIAEIFNFFIHIITGNNKFIIGVSDNGRKKLTQLIYYFNRKTLNKSILIVMGGSWPKLIIKDSKYKNMLSEYKSIYVETGGMMEELNTIGLRNVKIFPNCRKLPEKKIIVKKTNIKLIKCVYFSLISKEKGADTIFDAANKLDKSNISYKIDFYGVIENEFKPIFEKQLEANQNINYKGVFKTDINNVYEKLNEYDVLLFPTRWKNEGVPGILIESKIAGITSIVSDVNYNKEIVSDNRDGIVMTENNGTELANGIRILSENSELLYKMKNAALKTSKEYLIENYIQSILNDLK